jgi:hypothetical protein
MKRVSKQIIRLAAAAAIVASIVVQPAFAAAKTPDRGSSLGSLIRKIIRVLDTIDIRLPPG